MRDGVCVCLGSESGAANNGAWQVACNCLEAQRCAILNHEPRESRDNVIMLYNSVRAAFVEVLFKLFCMVFLHIVPSNGHTAIGSDHVSLLASSSFYRRRTEQT